jgi:hypothetical protein
VEIELDFGAIGLEGLEIIVGGKYVKFDEC